MKTVAVLLALFTAFGLLNSSTGSENSNAGDKNLFINPVSELRTGDIVVRSGKGFISDMFRSFNLSGDPWSHAGILVRENNRMMIYHIMGDSEEVNNRIRKEPLSAFCNSRFNSGFAVYRYEMSAAEEVMVTHYLDSLAGTGIRFDHQFDLDDDANMYCTELVFKTMLRAGVGVIPVSRMKGEGYIPVDNLYNHENVNIITEKHY